MTAVLWLHWQTGASLFSLRTELEHFWTLAPM